MFLCLKVGVSTYQPIGISNRVSHDTFYNSSLVHYPSVDDGDEVDIIGKFLRRSHILKFDVIKGFNM